MSNPAPARPRRARRGASSGILLSVCASGLLLVFLGLPFVSLLMRAAPSQLLQHLTDDTVQSALRLSLLTAASSTLLTVVFGTPLAWLLATREFRGKRVIETLVDLPMVLPPTVAGFALLLAFGRMGLAGRTLDAAGIHLPFTTLGVVAAQWFMSVPFYISPARAGFAAVDRRYLDAAETLGASESFVFTRIILPLARPALIAGIAMATARSLGEFGATIMFAGNLPGTTQTMPLAVYVAMNSDLDTAIVLAILLLVMSFALLLGLRASPSTFLWNRSRAASPTS